MFPAFDFPYIIGPHERFDENFSKFRSTRARIWCNVCVIDDTSRSYIYIKRRALINRKTKAYINIRFALIGMVSVKSFSTSISPFVVNLRHTNTTLINRQTEHI